MPEGPCWASTGGLQCSTCSFALRVEIDHLTSVGWPKWPALRSPVEQWSTCQRWLERVAALYSLPDEAAEFKRLLLSPEGLLEGLFFQTNDEVEISFLQWLGV